MKPVEDPNFSVWIDDKITYEGNDFVKVNFGEDDDPEEYGESFLLESALDEEVFLIFTEKQKGIPEYTAATGQVFRTEELAKIEEVKRHDPKFNTTQYYRRTGGATRGSASNDERKDQKASHI